MDTEIHIRFKKNPDDTKKSGENFTIDRKYYKKFKYPTSSYPTDKSLNTLESRIRNASFYAFYFRAVALLSDFIEYSIREFPNDTEIVEFKDEIEKYYKYEGSLEVFITMY